MDINGSQAISASRANVWKSLNDLEVLKQCIPGCQEMSGTPEEGFEAVVRAKIGPVNTKFKGRVSIEDVVDGESYRLVGEGSGGVAGFAKGAVNVRLDAVEGGTEILYEGDGRVGGKLAQIGSRLVEGAARRLTKEFFANFKAVVEIDPDTGDKDSRNGPDCPQAEDA